jgi:hypothetical protein
MISASGLPEHLAGCRLRSQCPEPAEIFVKSSESGVGEAEPRGSPNPICGSFASKGTTAATFGCSERPSAYRDFGADQQSILRRPFPSAGS